MNASVPSHTASALGEATSEDAETLSVAEMVKNLFKKNKKIIVISGGAALAVAASVFITLAKEQDSNEGLEPLPKSVAGGRKRQSPSMHEVAEHRRKTKSGYITVGPYVRGGSAA